MLNKRYMLESGLWIVGFVLAIESADTLAAWLGSAGMTRQLAMLPIVLPLGLGLWVELRQVKRLDELHRLMYLVATLAGSTAAIALCVVASVGELLVGWPRISPIAVIGALGGGFVVGWLGARYHFR